MSDGDLTQKDQIELDVRSGAVDESSTFEGLFPFEAFEFDNPDEDTTPMLTLKSPWSLNLTSVIQYTSRGNIMNVKSTGSDYTITDSDGYEFVRVTTAATDVTITLPTASDNEDRVIGFLKDDSGSGKLTIDGEGTEKIHACEQNQNTLDFELEDSGCYLLCDGTQWYVVRTIGCELWDIGGTIEAVYSKYFSGTTDNDNNTTFTHGISDVDKVVYAKALLYNSATSSYDIDQNATATSTFSAEIDSTNIIMQPVDSDFQGQNYRVIVRYYI